MGQRHLGVHLQDQALLWPRTPSVATQVTKITGHRGGGNILYSTRDSPHAMADLPRPSCRSAIACGTMQGAQSGDQNISKADISLSTGPSARN